MMFLQENSFMVMSVLEEMESEEMMLCNIYKILCVRLKVLRDQWSDHLKVLSEVDCLMNIIMSKNAFQELSTLSNKWNRTVERNRENNMKFTETGFWYHA